MEPEILPPLRVFAAPRPFSTVRIETIIPAGPTIAELVASIGGPGPLSAHVWVYHPGGAVEPIVVPRELWAYARPKPGMQITIRVVPTGGGGSNPLRIIALIAIAALAAWAGGALAGFLTPLIGATAATIAGGLASLAVTAIGSLLINALIPPPKPPSLTASGEKTTYQLTGTQNRANVYGVVPRVFGKMRVFPVYAARPYTESAGSSNYLRLLFDFGYGPLQLSDLRIGTVPIAQFEDIETEIRPGYDSDAAITLYTQTIREDSYNLRISVAGGAQTVQTHPNCDEFTLDISFPALLKINSDGDRVTRTVQVQVEYRAVGAGSWTVFSTETIQAATQRVYRWSVRIKPPSKNRYEIRLTRITPDSVGTNIQDESYLTAVRSIEYAAPVKPKGRCLVAMRIRASEQLSGVVDQFSAVAQALLPKWTGSAWTAPSATRNPAWAFCEVLRGKANGKAVADSRLDLTTIKAWADSCDAAAQDGQAKWTFDGVVDFSTTVFDLLRDIAAVGRAAPGMKDGKFSVVRDVAQSTPIQVFTPRNSWGFRGVKTFSDQPHGLRVRFIDPDREWSQQEVTVYDDGYSSGNATKFEGLDLSFGVTRRNQAWREGRYHMAVNRLRPETYEFWADIEHLVCTRGDMVRVAHDVPLWGGAQGRISGIEDDGAKVTAITLDEAVTMDPAKLHALRVRKQDGTQAVYSIATDTGPIRRLVLTSVAALAAAPSIGDLALFGEASRESVELVVKQIFPGPDLSARLVCVDAAPVVGNADIGDIPDFDPQISELPPVLTARPATPTIDTVISDERAIVRLPSGALLDRIIIMLGPRTGSAALDSLDTQYRRTDSGEGWSRVPYLTPFPAEVAISDVEEGVAYDLRVRAVSSSGVTSDWATVSGHTVIGKLAPPPSPTALLVERLPGGMIRYRWTHEQPIDHAGYLMRWAIGADLSWSRGLSVHQGLITTTSFESPAFTSRTFTVMVKAVDMGGHESDDLTAAVVNLGDAIAALVLDTTDFRALGWPGTLTGGAIIAGDIESVLTGVLFNVESEPLFANPADPISSNYDPVVYETTWTAPATGFLRLEMTSEGGVTLAYRIPGAGALYTNQNLPLPDPLFATGDYALYLGPFWVTAGDIIHLRIALPGGPTPAAVRAFQAIVEVQTETESFNDIPISAAGTRLPVTKSWNRILNVSVTCQEAGGYTGIRATILDKSVSGPMIKTYNAAGTAASGLIDATIQGVLNQ